LPSGFSFGEDYRPIATIYALSPSTFRNKSLSFVDFATVGLGSNAQYMEERKGLIDAARESARTFDQAVLAFGSAVFGASIAFSQRRCSKSTGLHLEVAGNRLGTLFIRTAQCDAFFLVQSQSLYFRHCHRYGRVEESRLPTT
jgi:hypothetical protein